MNTKIAIVVDCLSRGGAEKVAAFLSKKLSNEGFQVTVISILDEIEYSYSGRLINLGENNSSNKKVKQIQKLLKLRKAIKSESFDLIIDFRIRSRPVIELLLYVFVWANQQMVYTMHSHNLSLHIPKGIIFKRLYKKAKIVVVAKEIKAALIKKYNFKNISYIPNSINLDYVRTEALKQDLAGKYIVCVGNLNNNKQQDKLIAIYAKSSLKQKGIKLYLLGEGCNKQKLQAQIAELNLQEHVLLFGFVQNPYPYIKHAMFQVLCSKYEGFPMVLLEALALQTPVVSFNCKSGPSELIQHNKNGLLIEDQDWNALYLAIEQLCNSASDLEKLKQKTLHYLEPFTEAENYKAWLKIIQS
ncbi:MAG: glycosyltransferase [Oceanihabitans sp.]